MTKIIFIRHGQTYWNEKKKYQGQTDIPLNEKGIMQAEIVAQKLRKEKIDAIYASNLQRAYKTAEIIALEHDLTVHRRSGLNEFSFGVLEGKTYQDLKNDYPELLEWFKNPKNMNIPEAELITDLQERAVAVVKDIVENHEDETVLVASHGLTIAVILSYFLNIDINNATQMIQSNTGLTIAEFIDAKGILKLEHDADYVDYSKNNNCL